MIEDDYKTLGVKEDATDDDLRKRYRQLAFQYHPDRGGDEEFFKLLSAAFERVTKSRELAVREVRPDKATDFNTRAKDFYNDLRRPSGVDTEDFDKPKDARASAARPNLGRPTRRR